MTEETIAKLTEAFETAAREAVETHVENDVNLEADVEKALRDAVDDYDFDDAIGEAVRNYNFDKDIETAIEEFDFSDAAHTAVTEALTDGEADDAIKQAVCDLVRNDADFRAELLALLIPPAPIRVRRTFRERVRTLFGR